MTLGKIEGLKGKGVRIGQWVLDDADFMLIAMLQDPVYATELLWSDPKNYDYHGCYRVRDYQYTLFRGGDNVYQGFACARSTGKTESIKARSFTHPFRRHAENLLLTAPELIHLLPLTDAVEERIQDIRLTREFLDTRNQSTGFTHRPFGVNFIDGTKIVGRIPRLGGQGVKGQHEPDLIIDEAQDYPDAGWKEIHETVEHSHTDQEGELDASYIFYGVHSGDRSSGFHTRTTQGGFTIHGVTALQRPGWSKAEKDAAKAAYGGSSSADYRRNILGEAGSSSSAFFVISRLMSCLDQNRESEYNKSEYRAILYRGEEVDDLELPLAEILDLPTGYKEVWAGMDIGLTNSPTVISLFATVRDGKRDRLKLFRRLTLERFRVRQIREALYAIGHAYGSALHGFGMDITGLGLPIWQELGDDEAVPRHLLEVSRGYMFSAKVPVSVEQGHVDEDTGGQMRDQYGSIVKREADPLTGENRLVTYMPMIEASTRYLREFVDAGTLWLPFDTEVTSDMMGESRQRVKRTGQLKAKPNAFHILDSFRAMAMVYHAQRMESQLIDDEGGAAVLETTF